MSRDQLWTERRFGCGRTPRAVAPIPQITSLDPGRPQGTIDQGFAVGDDASSQRVSACCVLINHRMFFQKR
jgi:hypothetical protein